VTSELPGREIAADVMSQRASSFGQVAAQYERYRPGPPSAAIDWLLPSPVGTVVDLGAGTGALTRQLGNHAARVIAVEPDERMRSVLQTELPDATVLDGRGEAIPVADDSVDAVLASSSWHWMDPVPTLREVRRVLKSGGFVAAMWSGPDPDSPFIAQAQALLAGPADETGSTPGATATLRDTVAGTFNPATALTVPAGAPFSEPEHEAFRSEIPLNADELIGLLGTLSWIISMVPSEREGLFATARRLLRDALGIEGDVTVDVTFKCDTFRSYLIG